MSKIYKNTSGVVNYLKYLYKKDRLAKEEIKNMIEPTNNNILCDVCIEHQEKTFYETIKNYSDVGEIKVICKSCSENYRIVILEKDFDGLIKIYPTPSQNRKKSNVHVSLDMLKNAKEIAPMRIIE